MIIFNWHYRQRKHHSGTKERTRALNGVYAEEKTSHQEIVGGIWLYRGHTQEGHTHENQIPHHSLRILSVVGECIKRKVINQ